MATFFERIHQRVQEKRTLLVAGLDPHPEFLDPPSAAGAEAFCLRLAEATAAWVAAFKVNAAFFEFWGSAGWKALERLIARLAPLAPVILDAKRGDVPSTARAYASSAFDTLGAHAVTLFPHLGQDALQPFLAYADRGLFLIVRTSNPAAADVQDLPTLDREPYYAALARWIGRWAPVDRVGVVVGATQPHSLRRVRRLLPRHWILAPGVGAQGGDLTQAYHAARRRDGLGVLFPVSRGLAQARDPAHQAQELARRTWQMVQHPAATGPAEGTVPQDLKVTLARDLVHTGCVRFGHFRLKSGHTAPIYFDLRRLVGFPQVLQRVALAYGLVLQSLTFRHLAPLPYAALPIGTAVGLMFGWSLVYPRKEVKTYGTGASVEGVYFPKETVVMLDDVLTTGRSKQEALHRLQQAGLQVHDVVVLIDREAGGRQTLEAQGLRVHAVFTLRELLDLWQQFRLVPVERLTAVRNWLEAPAPSG